MKEELFVSEMQEGDLGYTTPWAFNKGRFNRTYVYSERGGTASAEVELRCGEIVPTEAGRKSIDDYRKKKLLVSEMREGDLGYTTPWAFYMNGRLNLPYVYAERGGTACTEVELRGGEIVPTEAGRKSIDDYRKS